jgi:inorganic pyrophosphatase
MANLEQLPLRRDGVLNAVVETPRGSRVKFSYHAPSGLFEAKKLLALGLAFPFAFGFFPSTRGGDGKPLDVLILTDAQLLMGTLVAVGLIGVIELEQISGTTRERNDRLLAVPLFGHQDRPVRDLAELPKGEVDDIEAFLVAYQERDGTKMHVLGREGADAAERLLREFET